MRKLAALTLALLLLPSFASALIALDTSGAITVGASPRAQSYTAAGSNIEMVVCTYQSVTTDNISSVTFGATNLTKQAVVLADAALNDYTTTIWAGAVSAATANITVTSSSGNVGWNAATYTGVLTGIGQATSTNTSPARTSVTLTYTTAISNSWAVLCGSDGGGNPAASTNLTSRQASPGGAILGDSNGTITNPFSMTFTFTGGSLPAGAVGVTLDPTAAVSVPFYTNARWWFVAR